MFTNIDIHGCTIAQSERGILMCYSGTGSANWNIYSNVILNCSWGIGIGSGNNNSILNGINVSDNRISGQSTWDTANNYFHENAIYVYAELPGAAVTNVTIVRNTLGPDDGTHATACIFLSASCGGSGGIWGVSIYNNVLFSKNTYVNCGFIYLYTDINDVKILNNTFDAGGSGTGAINILTCARLTIYNNIYSDGQQAVSLKYSPDTWWAAPVVMAQISAIDFNDYYNLTGGSVGWGGNGERVFCGMAGKGI